MRRADYLDRARRRGVNPLAYWLVRAILQPVFRLVLRMSRVGREHVLVDGPMIIAANHRWFFDPVVVGLCLRRPVYFVAKSELFRHRPVAWLLNALGAFPVERGSADRDAISTAREIIQRGDVVVLFPEGTRVPPGGLGRPKRGVGRLALETGAPVVPMAVRYSPTRRRGWRVHLPKVRVRIGPPLRFPRVEEPSPQLAGAVTDRIWPHVGVEWEQLGGLGLIRRAVVVGEGPSAAGLTTALRAADVEVTPVAAGAAAELTGQDLVVVAVRARELAATVAALGPRVPLRACVLVAAAGTVAPGAAAPEDVARRVAARAVATLGGRDDALRVASDDRDFADQLSALLRRGGLSASASTDVAGVQAAGLVLASPTGARAA
jgi:glycerol-3-phosphate dehydrogenase (NAD(P)+)